jgi:hypothetical protein
MFLTFYFFLTITIGMGYAAIRAMLGASPWIFFGVHTMGHVRHNVRLGHHPLPKLRTRLPKLTLRLTF